MNLELFIARKIHFNKEGDRQATPPAIRIAMIGIALGLAVMILSVAIVIGFKKEVRNKVIGFGTHIQISNFDNNTSYETIPIAFSDTLLQALAANPADKRSTDVLISKYLSDLLGLKLNDSFLTYFVGEEVRVRKFHISGIYETGFADYDKLFVFADIRQVRRLNGWDDDQVSGIELLVHDYDQLDQTAEDLYFEMANRQDRQGNSYYVRSIKDLNPMIFSWLDVLDINVVVILVLMLAVAGFTMISGLLIIILERTNMIGILKALGQNNRSIRKVFLYVSFFLIGKGMLWGNLIGIAICVLQSTTHILKLDPTIYYLDAVPIDLSITSLILLNIGTLAISMLMMLGPSYLITQISPARSIRFE